MSLSFGRRERSLTSSSFDDDDDDNRTAAFFTSQLTLGEDTIKFEIWDTAGQERYQSLAPMYYRNARCAVVVYDITDAASFERAKKWVDELISSASLRVVIALCGNKCDLEDDRKVSTETAQQYAESQGLIFFETSAKTRKNVRETFESIAKNLDRSNGAGEGSGGGVTFPDEKTGGGCAC